MRILLDENMPAKVNYDFGKGHEVRTVKDMKWSGKKNGELLGLAAFNGFDVVITLDKNLKNQQNLDKLDLKFIVLLAKNNKPETIQPFVAKIKALLLNGSDLPKLTELPQG
jgi:predicted nuclease of predicted toxin-antitoxin system